VIRAREARLLPFHQQFRHFLEKMAPNDRIFHAARSAARKGKVSVAGDIGSGEVALTLNRPKIHRKNNQMPLLLHYKAFIALLKFAEMLPMSGMNVTSS
jgi:hypothetical protein